MIVCLIDFLTLLLIIVNIEVLPAQGLLLLLSYTNMLFSSLPLDSLTFTPNTPLCVGEEVIMTCYVEAPTSQMFGSTNARISVNGSFPVSANTLSNEGITGLDISRYSADIMGLTVSTSRAGLRLVISGYLPSDSITTFQCAGLYPNDSFYYSLTPMSPMDPAG